MRRSLLAVAGLLPMLLGGVAHADEPSKTGWWNAASAGGFALPQSTTGEADLHVGQGPNGPSAYAAVAYDLTGQDLAAATLQLSIVPSSAVGTIDVVACPTAGPAWRPGGNQPYDAAPRYDCANGVPGAVAADASTVTFLLDAGQQVPTGGYDLAIVPAADAVPFRVDFAEPAATSLAPQAPAPDEPAPAPAAPVAPPPEAARPAPGSSGVAGGAPAVAVGAPLPEPVPVPQPVAVAAPVPLSAAPPPAAAPPVQPVSDSDRYAAGALLVLLAGGLLWACRQPARAPRLIGGLARRGGGPERVAAGARPRGIGRFATPRTGPARRLV